MSKTVVQCSQCGKQLFLTDTPETNGGRGKIAHEVKQHGYIAKLPMFYGHPRFEFFCCKECKEKWCASIPQEIREQGNKDVRQLSEVMNSEDFQRGLREGLSRIQQTFNRLRKPK